MNYKNRGNLNPALKWLWDLLSLYSTEEITIPTEFHQRVQAVKDVLNSDTSGIVNSLLDFAINCADVNYQIETENIALSKKLNEWLFSVNEDLRGKIPPGIDALAKEYFRERWKGSSLILLRSIWEKIDGFELPVKLWFIDGINLEVRDGNSNFRVIGEEQYYLKLGQNKVKLLPAYKNELIFVQKPYSSWSSLYPIPFLIERGLYKNLKFFELINRKSEKIIGKALEYLLLLKKGSEQLALKNIPEFICSEEDLKAAKTSLQDAINKGKTEAGTPSYVTNFDTELEHLIPDYTKAINSNIYSPIEKRLLAGLGMIDIIQGISSTRRESVLNPKPFEGEVNQGINDFKALMLDILKTIAERNSGSHRKYFNSDIQVYSSPITQFITDDIRNHLRSMYDRGILSKQTYLEVVGNAIDFSIEIQRRKDETKDGLNEILYPPVIQNTELKPADLSPFKKQESIPEDKLSPDAKNFKSNKGQLIIYLAKCKKCGFEFDYENTPEKSMGVIKCPGCDFDLRDEDLEFIKPLNLSDEDIETSTIVKRKDGYYVLSEKTGKSLGGPYKTYKEALKRLRQIEFFKNH